MIKSLKSAVFRNAPMLLGLLVVSLIAWPLFDLAIGAFITHAAFHYSIMIHIVRPVLFVAAFAIVEILVDMNSQKA